jgi:DNA-3-methyladenine glycosylase
MRKVLPKNFFNRKTETVAKELLGKFLVHKIGTRKIESIITEVEAYVGPHDLACHSAKGRTARTEVMYKEAATIYVYLVYGMHEMLNIVTEECDYPAAILIRGTQIATGPGRVTKKFHIDRKLNGLTLSKKTGLWVEDRGLKVPKSRILKTPRIGVNYAGPIWKNKKLRFVLKN